MKDGTVIEDPILYCHQETVVIGSTTYYLHKKDVSADAAGTTLSVSAAAVALLVWGKFVLSLANVQTILAGTIAAIYRVSVSSATVVMNGQVDIIIRTAADAIRTTIASNVSASASTSSTTWVTLTGANYSFAAYIVVDQTDYLEIDFKCNVTTKKAGASAYLRIDDNTLAVADQTRTTGWGFQYAISVSEPSIAISDAVTIAIIRACPVSEPSISVSDAVERGLFLSRSISEPSIDVSDSVGYNLQRARSPSELLGSVSDAVAVQMTRAVSLSEPPIAVSDAFQRALLLARSALEDLGAVSDAPVTALIRAVPISEQAISVADAVAHVLQRAVAISENLGGVSDSAIPSLIRSISLSEPAIGVSDLVISQMRRAIDVSEPSISLLDAAIAEKIATSVIVERAVDEALGSVGDYAAAEVIGAPPITRGRSSRPGPDNPFQKENPFSFRL